VNEIESIAAVEGIDGIFIGPSDLAADLGHLGNPAHPEVQAAISAAGARIRTAGKAAGILTTDSDAAGRFFDMGFTFVAAGSDAGVLARGTAMLAAQCKEKAALHTGK
jgi:4-hydroxy-2-oxoheptanedioate aldolase